MLPLLVLDEEDEEAPGVRHRLLPPGVDGVVEDGVNGYDVRPGVTDPVRHEVVGFKTAVFAINCPDILPTLTAFERGALTPLALIVLPCPRTIMVADTTF